MRLVQLTMQDYKAFRQTQIADFRPLTVVIGKNSSGKSAFLRLPILLMHALSTGADAPLDLAFDDLDFGGSFRDLIHNQSPHGSVKVGLTLRDIDGKEYQLFSKVQYYDDIRLQLVETWELKLSSGESFALQWTDTPESLNLDGRVYTLSGSYQGKFKTRFAGLIPEFVDATPADVPWLAEFVGIMKKLNDISAKISHLGPFRDRPSRQYQFPGQMPRGARGHSRRSPQILGADYNLKRGILEAVGKWFQDNLDGWQLDIAATGGSFELVLKNTAVPEAAINLVDVGQGMSQVLPLVVQRYYDMILQPNTVLEVIEQPELHLHPAVHGALADLYISSIAASPTSFLIETHSEMFCLRLRRRVAEKKLDPSKVVIFSIESEAGSSVIKPIQISEDGGVNYWPRGVFSEDFVETKGIASASRGNAKP